MVTIKLFGTLRLKTGSKGLEADVSTVKEGCEALTEATGLPFKEIKRCIIVVNGTQNKKMTAPLKDGDELAFFSPSGGG